MESKCLDEIIIFTLGKNITRLKNQRDDIYTPDDFEKDLHSINKTNEKSDCVINLIRSKAAPLSEETEEKCLTSNFLLCSIDTKVLDPWYFCYQFNEGKSFEQQISMYHQGNTLSVRKLNIQSISKLKIQLINLGKQKLIGNIYKQSIIQNDLMKRQAEDIRNLALETIRKIEED